MPATPPRRVPGRGSTGPGTRRALRLSSGHESEQTDPSAQTSLDDETAGSASSHVNVGGRAISTVALSVTQRVIALAATLAVLVISFVSSFGVYFSQQREIAQAKAEIATHQSQITRLQDEIERWNDPAYVKAQARDRLGWVLPGEVGYRVVDENGDVVGGIDVTTPPAPETTDQVWYEALWGSVRNADQPVVATQAATQKPVDNQIISSDDATGQ